jgi:hypothetical protein
MTDDTGCLNPGVMVLVDGNTWDLDNPELEKIHLKNIAHSLALECRYANQTRKHYSVAEHSLICLQLYRQNMTFTGREAEIDRDVERAVLLHDAEEAFTGDVIRPIKIKYPEVYEAIAGPTRAAIEKRFDVDFTAHKAIIKFVDNWSITHEVEEQFPPGTKFPGLEQWQTVPGVRAYGMAMADAAALFLAECFKLGIEPKEGRDVQIARR